MLCSGMSELRRLSLRSRNWPDIRLTIAAFARLWVNIPFGGEGCFPLIWPYLRTYRLQVAKKLLLETESSVTEIASKIGYENPNKFTSAFKETYGSSPTEFRKSVRLDRSGSVWSGEEIWAVLEYPLSDKSRKTAWSWPIFWIVG